MRSDAGSYPASSRSHYTHAASAHLCATNCTCDSTGPYHLAAHIQTAPHDDRAESRGGKQQSCDPLGGCSVKFQLCTQYTIAWKSLDNSGSLPCIARLALVFTPSNSGKCGVPLVNSSPPRPLASLDSAGTNVVSMTVERRRRRALRVSSASPEKSLRHVAIRQLVPTMPSLLFPSSLAPPPPIEHSVRTGVVRSPSAGMTASLAGRVPLFALGAQRHCLAFLKNAAAKCKSMTCVLVGIEASQVEHLLIHGWRVRPTTTAASGTTFRVTAPVMRNGGRHIVEQLDDVAWAMQMVND